MWCRSLRAFDALLEQPATLLLQRGAVVARSAQGGKQLWRRQAARHGSTASAAPFRSLPFSARTSIVPAERATLTTMVARLRPSQPKTPFCSPSFQSRRAFHSSRPRRSQGGSQAGDTGPKAGSSSGSGSGSGAGAGSGSATAEPQSITARLKKLSREYGWTAVGVYFGLSLLDFPFCFLLVRTLGTEKIAAAEEFVVSHVRAVIPASVKEFWYKYREALKEAKRESGSPTDQVDATGWGVKEAEERNLHEASLATQLALAYAIHKSFIFVRVPLTAAVTPKVVQVLRSWGWKIGKRKPAA